MAWGRIVEDDQIASAYEQLGSVWKVGQALGMCGQSVHERLARMGKNKPINVFTEADRQRLRDDYAKYRDAGQVSILASEMGRTVQFLSRQARALGLTEAGKSAKGNGRFAKMTDAELEVFCLDFLEQDVTLTRWCEEKGISDDGFRLHVKSRLPGLWEKLSEKGRSYSAPYVAGRSHEYAVCSSLKGFGYFVVRSPGSIGPFDVFAVKSGSLLFVECKLGGLFDTWQWNNLFRLSNSVGAIPLMAESANGSIKFWKLLAEKTGSKKRQPKIEWIPS